MDHIIVALPVRPLAALPYDKLPPWQRQQRKLASQPAIHTNIRLPEQALWSAVCLLSRPPPVADALTGTQQIDYAHRPRAKECDATILSELRPACRPPSVRAALHARPHSCFAQLPVPDQIRRYGRERPAGHGVGRWTVPVDLPSIGCHDAFARIFICAAAMTTLFGCQTIYIPYIGIVFDTIYSTFIVGIAGFKRAAHRLCVCTIYLCACGGSVMRAWPAVRCAAAAAPLE